MCYAIPGKVIEINDNIVTVEYFGQKKKARNEFFELTLNDYIYAQGGFVIQKIPSEKALSILETWQEFFLKLQEIDLRLTRQPQNLFQIANSLRQKHLGNSCCVHGIIEFSNFCRNNCLYCGIRKDNSQLKRYRMSIEEIVNSCDYAVNKLKFKALVLQSGEDLWYDDEKLVNLVKQIREKCAALIIFSIGERNQNTYEKLYEAGARGVLLRFETSNEELYMKYRPGKVLQDRINLINELRKIGYLIMTGFLISLPGQTEQDILNDIELTNSLQPEMFSFGPFIPHPQTPLSTANRPSLDLVLTTIARTRILYPESRILVTTALETLDKTNGARLGLLSGANSLMINITPEKYRKLYEIYPDRAGIDIGIEERISDVLNLLQELGRAPTDLGI
ncbi:MAG: [FeFe] hydrogenase H-cluster radical SAM maturase HydE [Elusimicrobiota bacterium]|nr:[FeFe] hydrogenase H-cluster radical SAM maturase HydE [Elusimicrobiota bacterium]